MFLDPAQLTRQSACERPFTELTVICWKNSYRSEIAKPLTSGPSGALWIANLSFLSNFINVYEVLKLLTAPYFLPASIEHHPLSLPDPFPGSWLLGWCCDLRSFTRAIAVATGLEPCSGAWWGHQWECNYRQWFPPLPKSISTKYLSSEGLGSLSFSSSHAWLGQTQHFYLQPRLGHNCNGCVLVENISQLYSFWCSF